MPAQQAAHPTAPTAPGPLSAPPQHGQPSSSYARRRPETTALHSIASAHLETVLARARARSDHGFGYPRFVEREFEKFLDCGIIRRGFVRVRCGDCKDERLVAFSCKTRGVCPSCTSRRMASTAAHLVDHVFPVAPYRQWVISFPKRIRWLLARDHKLLTKVLRLCLCKLFAWQRRRARRLGIRESECGAVTFVQRFGSLLNLNVHFHILVPDGVFCPGRDGTVGFRPVPPPWDEDIARLIGQIGRAVEKLVAKRQEDAAEDGEPISLAQDQAKNLATKVPGAPSWTEPPRTSTRKCAFLYGYSLHANRFIDVEDRAGLERLCRYGARAPVANSRLSLDKAGNAVLRLKRPYFDGRTQLTFKPVELLRRLATLIPPPRKNLTRYHGVFAPGHRWRQDIVPGPTIAPTGDDSMPANARPVGTTRLTWAELLRRVFAVDVLVCERCGGAMRILAVLPESDITDTILDHLGQPQHPP